ncbi:MAG: gamma-glutamyltransferase [Steroidobacteraceae bacterium]|jgi:gamma-glutamyltranspeptidase/glutathione hydrolase
MIGTRSPLWREAQLLLGIGLLSALLGLAQAAAPRSGAIASASPLAAAAGIEILRAGGNAFDAAVAVTAALAVAEPNGSGLTGGGFYLLHRGSDGVDKVIDARERAPGAATRDMFLDAHGEPVPDLSTESALAAGIPGEPAGMAWLAAHYGRLPVARTLAPAIRLARDGFALTPRLQAMLQEHLAQFAADPEIAKNFLRAGAVPEVGTLIRQPELARTLEQLARHGLGSFYHGALAKQLVAGVRAQGGIWSERDLADYHAVEREPLVGHYRDARIVSVPPSSSGGVALIETLNLLSGFELPPAGSVARLHLIVESLRRVYRDRAEYLGDTDFVSVPVARLIDPAYAATLRTGIHADRATPSAELPGFTEPSQGPQTTHFSILDRNGNRVAATITLNFWFGSGRMVAGTGLFLNNEMDDFSIKPGVPNGYGLVGNAANAIAPGKRMLSSATPMFIETPDRVLIAGSPGGSLIISMAVQATLGFLDGEDAAQIVAAPRIHHQYLPDLLMFEPGALDEEQVRALEALGHHLKVQTRRWGNMQAVIWNTTTGAVEAAADPRGEGAGLTE